MYVVCFVLDTIIRLRVETIHLELVDESPQKTPRIHCKNLIKYFQIQPDYSPTGNVITLYLNIMIYNLGFRRSRISYSSINYSYINGGYTVDRRRF